ncbi:hypothetical protein [Bacillus sp. 2205SS5-2]|uniref:hypothetical protein n=1 Tax=Bacillus sp. 2205SS5-2 TaxID=3109031 RepID=UPI003005E027
MSEKIMDSGSDEQQEDHFSKMMFGSNRPNRTEHQAVEEEEVIESDEESNSDQLMDQIFNIFQSLQEIKPLLSEFSPMVDYIKKKLITKND